MNTVLQSLTLAGVIALLWLALTNPNDQRIDDLCAYIKSEANITSQEWAKVSDQDKALLAYVCQYHGPSE